MTERLQNAHKILLPKTEVKKSFLRPRRRCENINKEKSETPF
jgi:hypothetical protein